MAGFGHQVGGLARAMMQTRPFGLIREGASLRLTWSGRGVIELCIALTTVAMSTLLFGWATLGWWEPSSASGVDELDSLILYTNDPSAKITGQLAFGPDGDSTEAVLSLDFAVAPAASQTFRFALIGRNKMMFDAQGFAPGSTSQPPVTRPQRRTRDCDSGSITGIDETILVGGLGNAHLLGTDVVISVAPGTLATELHFPQLRRSYDGTQYSVDLGNIGQPTDKNRQQMGPLLLDFPEKTQCVDLGGGDDVGNSGKLHAAAAAWTVNVSGQNAQDRLLIADPVSTHPGSAVWTITTLTRPNATYIDTGLDKEHQIALFIGGLAAGIGTTYLAQGVTTVTSGAPPAPNAGNPGPEKVTKARKRRRRR
jgi:hypothetical protein